MKRITIKLIGIVVPLMMMTACLFEEENIFDKSAALRMNEEIKADIASLPERRTAGWSIITPRKTMLWAVTPCIGNSFPTAPSISPAKSL